MASGYFTVVIKDGFIADSEPQSKVQKLDEESDEKDVFTSFHTRYDKDEMDILRRAYGNLSDFPSKHPAAFKAIEIVSSDCRKSSSFSKAFLDVKEHKERVYLIGPIFESGLRHLYNFLARKDVPKDEKIKEILGSLLNYLLDKDILDSLKDWPKRCKSHIESDVALFVLNHIVMPLTPPTQCYVDCYVQDRSFVCPDQCKNKALESVKSGDTSIGCPELWHGRVDAVVGSRPNIAVKMIPDEERGDGSPGFRSCIEFKQTFNRPSNQIMSQAIVFSFLQQKLHPKLQVSLIPTIGISAEELVIYFYDCKKDILLQSLRGFRFQTSESMERTCTILVMWLVINYKYLSEAFAKTLQQAPKANFFKVSGDKLQMYKDDVIFGGVGDGVSYNADTFFDYAEATHEIPSSYQEIKCLPSGK